jgi:tRNA (uracil-5-)-methyltransferase TRM9
MNIFEENNVLEIYNLIANKFDNTRQYHWKCVKEYINSINSFSLDNTIDFIDIGCGNGKYFSLCNNFRNVYAVDNSIELLSIVKHRYPNVKTLEADATDIPVDDKTFDYAISIAVIHHLSTEERRINLIDEIYRILKPNGTCMVTAWASTINKSKFEKLDNHNDYLIPWDHKYMRFYHLFDENEFDILISKSKYSQNIEIIKKIFECDNWAIIIKKLK